MEKKCLLFMLVVLLCCLPVKAQGDPTGLWNSSNGVTMSVALQGNDMIYVNLSNNGSFKANFFNKGNDGSLTWSMDYMGTYYYRMVSDEQIFVYFQNASNVNDLKLSSVWTKTNSSNVIRDNNYRANNKHNDYSPDRSTPNTALLENEICMIESQLKQAEINYNSNSSAVNLQLIHALQERLTRAQQNLYNLKHQK